MENIILLISVMVVGACGKGKETQTKTKGIDNNGTTSKVADTNAPKPVKELTLEEKVIGTYELKRGSNTYRQVLLENGDFETYVNGKKLEREAKWKLTKEGEIHDTHSNGISVLRINQDRSTTQIAWISEGGKREDLPKEEQTTFKKIK